MFQSENSLHQHIIHTDAPLEGIAVIIAGNVQPYFNDELMNEYMFSKKIGLQHVTTYIYMYIYISHEILWKNSVKSPKYPKHLHPAASWITTIQTRLCTSTAGLIHHVVWRAARLVGVG